MVVAVTAYDSQNVINVVSESLPNAYASTFGVLAVYNHPAVTAYNAQTDVVTVNESLPDANASQLEVVVVYAGYTKNHKLRVWTFTLDGHDFYVIRLGEEKTLVYDLTTEQWSEWQSGDYNIWRAHRGTNWIGMGKVTYSGGATSNVVAGDFAQGRLWTLDPTVGYDEDIDTLVPTSFYRRVVGGIQQKLRTSTPVGAAYLLCSAGSAQLTGTGIQLRTSDDGGKNWVDHGTVNVTPGNYTQEYVWRSLGLIKQPGKLFEISDYGASVRIDSLDIR